jgi:hypothetical protein
LITSGRSLIKILKSRSPKTDLCGTPDRTTKGEENRPEKRTQDSLLVKYYNNNNNIPP